VRRERQLNTGRFENLLWMESAYHGDKKKLKSKYICRYHGDKKKLKSKYICRKSKGQDETDR